MYKQPVLTLWSSNPPLPNANPSVPWLGQEPASALHPDRAAPGLRLPRHHSQPLLVPKATVPGPSVPLASPDLQPDPVPCGSILDTGRSWCWQRVGRYFIFSLQAPFVGVECHLSRGTFSILVSRQNCLFGYSFSSTCPFSLELTRSFLAMEVPLSLQDAQPGPEDSSAYSRARPWWTKMQQSRRAEV